MSVNQLGFLTLVFLSLVVYYVIPKKYQWCVLLGFSLWFYYLMGAYTFVYVILTAGSLTLGTQQIYVLDKRLQKALNNRKRHLTRRSRKALKNMYQKRKRKWMILLIVLNLGILLVLKYGDFFVENVNALLGKVGINEPAPLGLAAPLGISYYTLQAIGYVLDVSKGKAVPEKNPLKVLLFVTWYPQMTQGPIGRFPDLTPQLLEDHDFSIERFYGGCRRILWGLFKKMIIANNLKPLVDSIFGQYDQVGGFTLFLGCIYMVFQMYADFSGYTDIVLGISGMYGISMMENFKRPLFSASLGEYWRRWHISLSSWFRDYVFYPVSISKGAVSFGKWGQNYFSPRIKKVFPVVYAMSVVWFCTGLWHDASWRYILWGVANGVVLIGGVLLEPQFSAAKKVLHIREEAWWWKGFSILRTFLIVALLKVFPAADSTAGSFVIIGRILGDFHPCLTYQALFLDTVWQNIVFGAVGLAVFFCAELLETRKNLWEWINERSVPVRWSLYLLLIAMIVFMGNFDAVTAGGFEYAQF